MVCNGPGPGVNGEIELSAVKHKDKLKPHYPGKSSKIELSPAPFLGVVTIHLLVQKALAFGELGCKRGNTRTSQELPLWLQADLRSLWMLKRHSVFIWNLTPLGSCNAKASMCPRSLNGYITAI